jgi:hypothetical protein
MLYEIILLFIMSSSSPNSPSKPSGNESTEVVDGGKGYVHPPEFYHDVNNHGLLFEDVKRCHLTQPLQQLYDRNVPKAKRIIYVISNPPLPFQSDDVDSTFPYFSEGGHDVNDCVGDNVDDDKYGDKVDSSQKVEVAKFKSNKL